MTRICAWCGKELEATDHGAGVVTTHGLCNRCAHHLFAQLGMPLQEYLDGLEAPILVVDADGTVKMANEQARALLQKDTGEIAGYKGGDVFECAYAELPEGCGNTIHCSGCAIRRTVLETYETGSSCLRVPASLDRHGTNSLERIRFLISTEKAGDVVLLRIDSVGEQESPLTDP